MTGLVLALGCAVAYGLSDFVGGLASRRTAAWAVAVVAQASSAGSTVLVAAVIAAGSPTPRDLLWGALAGLGNGMGAGFLYRGLATGRMGVVAPVSAVGAAVVPVVVGVLTGERPGPVVWVGILAALPGLWLVSGEDAAASRREEPASARGALLDGVLAGLGFGVLFAALGQVEDGAGFWPLVTTQAVSVVAVAALATLLRVSWWPRQRAAAWGLLCGPLAAAAAVAFLLSLQGGLLTVSSVVAALYPAVTVLLAVTVLSEHLHRTQVLGLALCAAAVGLVAAG